MSALNAATVLAVWETGTSQSLVQRALTLLGMAWPDRSMEEWAGMSVGQRDAGLLTLREELFGARVEGTAVCPQCDDRIETSFSTDDIRVAGPVPGATARVAADGFEVECRPLTSTDLLEVATSAAGAREALLRRCMRVTGRPSDAASDPAQLPEAVIQAAMQEMAAADPQADVQVALTCPACQHGWLTPFDIVSYLWSEIDDLAHRLLREVHALASVYGWHERDILAMSARRRRLYVEMMGI